MYELIDHYQTNPHRRALDLQFKNIKDLTQMTNLLAKFKNLQQLRLHGNKITYIPNIEQLSNLITLDISNNPIKIDSHLLDHLFLLPKLQNLYINANKDQQRSIIQALPKLKYLNDEFIKREAPKDTSNQQFLAMQAQKLNEQMLKIRGVYNAMSKALEEGRDGQTTEQEFAFLYKDVVQEMNYFYSGLRDELSRGGIYAYCKNKLTSILDNHLLRLLEENGLQSLVHCVESINKIKNQNFEQLLKIIFSASYETYMEDALNKPHNRLRKEKLYHEEILRLKKQTIQLKKQKNQIDVISTKETALQRVSAINSKRSQAKSISKSPSKRTIVTQDGKNSRNLSKSVSKKQIENKANQCQRAIPLSSHKSLTLQQLTVLSQEIMREKSKFNVRCRQKGQAYQTAEDFLFTFFSRRYGLQDIALEWSLSVIKAIEQYSKQKIQIEIFGKILKNQLYQEYYEQHKEFEKYTQKKLKQMRIGMSSTIDQVTFKRIFFQFFHFQEMQTYEKLMKKIKFPLDYKSIVRFLHNYKLNFEQKHLKGYIQTFQRVDHDEDGILTQSQAKQLIQNLIKPAENQDQSELQKAKQGLKQEVDLLRKDSIIFSQLFQIIHQFI